MPVALPVTAPETLARAALKTIIDTEFAAEGFTASNDKLHGSLGEKGTRIGIYPVQSGPRGSLEQVLKAELMVQFYGKWRKIIDPNESVDPSVIETFAERFRRALEGNDPNTDQVWYFRLPRLTYPPDPTGNISRFEATVEAIGQNPALVETVG